MPKRGERTAGRATVTCPCGKQFEVRQKRLEQGRGRYCSRECRSRYMTRPSGLTYVKHKDNPTSFKPGCPPNSTSFRPGQAPWNKGIPTGRVPANAFKPGELAGTANPRWAGDNVGYQGLHIRVYNERGPAANYTCQHADGTCRGLMHWANISHEYRDVEDFMPLCQSHHFRYDGVNL